jgi:hypothetical protein
MNDLRKFRDELPFGDDVLREIRNDVLKRIECEPGPKAHWLGLFVRTSFAAIALIVFVVWQTGESPRPRVVESPSRRAVETVRPTITTLASNPSEPRRLEDPKTPNVRRAARRRTRITRPAPIPASAEPAAVRIELHTSNPDIRILWINQSSGETR